MWRSITQLFQYVIEAILLSIFGISRIVKAMYSRGDVYDAKVICASDISDLGGHKLAIKWLSGLIASKPSEPRAYFERAMTYLEVNNIKLAREDFEKCLTIDPTFPGAKDWYEHAKK